MKLNMSEDWQDQEALERFQIITPLLQEELDRSKKQKLREEIAEKYDRSVRTIRRYEKAFQAGGFGGLRPTDRKKQFSSRLPANFAELLSEGIQLKREVPKRSVITIIRILEWEEKVPPGVLKRSTFERHLYKAGFGVKQMRMYNDAREGSTKRFCKPNRMMLVQSDVKYGPSIPCGKNGKLVKTYLSSVLDDHSRFALSSEFYDNQSESIVADAYRKAILNYGVFSDTYQDNGSQYRSNQLLTSLSRLGIKVHFAPIRSAKSKGKIEKFHQVVDAFLEEVKLKNIKTLEELNYHWKIYLEEYYHKMPHEGIAEYYRSLDVDVPEGGITPLQEFNRDKRPLKFLDASVVAEAFLHHEYRLVDKGACISFDGKKYETRTSLIGAKVEISFDPYKRDVLTVSYPGIEPFTVTPLKIDSFCDKTPAIPASMTAEKPETSRLLDVLEKKHNVSIEQVKTAISYASLLGGKDDV